MRRKAASWFVVLAIINLSYLQKGAAGLPQMPPDGQTVAAFIVALQNHDTNAAWQLLGSNTNLARPLGFGPKLALLEAAGDGDLRVVKRLVELGTDVDAVGDTWLTGNAQMTALEAAARNGHTEICQWLLEKGADPNHRSFSGETALHLALEDWPPKAHGQEIARLLLDHGANPLSEAGYYKTTPLDLEITKSDGQLVPLMLERVRGKNASHARERFLENHGQTVLRAAVQRGELEPVQALLQAGVSATRREGGNYSLFQTLCLAQTQAHRTPDFSPERWAKIRELLQKHDSPYDVLAATGFGDLKAAQQFWAADKSIIQAQDSQGDGVLHWSVRADQMLLTDFWLAAGASPAAMNLAGDTPLHLAAELGLTNQASRLLAAGAPLGVKDTNGLTAFDVAVQAQQTGVIRLLLGRQPTGASPHYGFSTPFHIASENGDTNLLLQTLRSATNVDARNELGFTPFQVAVLHGHLLAATMLLDAGADVDARDAHGNTALHLILLHSQVYLADLPPMAWYARLRQDPQMTDLFSYLLLGGPESQQSALFTTAVFLLANKADAAATNDAGQSATQLAMSQNIFLFDNERSMLLRLLEKHNGAAANSGINARDANGETALFRAVRDISGGNVDELIAAGADVNATNNLGRTPLHASVEGIFGWPGPLLELLKAGANANAQDNQGLTPLEVLALSANNFRQEATRALLEAGAKPDVRDKQGRTASQLFLTGKWPWNDAGECIALLLQSGASPFTRDNQGRTVLHYLAAMGDQHPLFFIHNITNCFSPSEADIEARDNAGDTPLHVAARTGTTDVFNWLVQRGANLDVTNNAGETPRLLALRSTDVFARHDLGSQMDIFQAAKDGNLEAVSNLLKTMPALLNSTNFFGDTPLRVAAVNHRTNIVEFLAQRGAPWDPLSALWVGRDEILKELIARRPQLITNSFGGQTLLHVAAAHGDVAAVKLLLAAGSELQAPDVWGLSPLGVARAHHQEQIARLFLRRGARENIFDAVSLGDEKSVKTLLTENRSFASAASRSGLPVTAIATALGNSGILKRLLDDGGPTAYNGNTLLHIAAVYDQSYSAALLLQRGALVDVYDRFGYTPLHLAAFQGSTRVAALLLQRGWFKHGADPDARTIAPPTRVARPRFLLQPLVAGNTALHLAALNAQTNMIALLLNAGAAVNLTNAAGMVPLDCATLTGPPVALGFPEIIPGRRVLLNFEPGILSQPSNSFASWSARKTAAVDMLEKAGAKHGLHYQQDFSGPHLMLR